MKGVLVKMRQGQMSKWIMICPEPYYLLLRLDVVLYVVWRF